MFGCIVFASHILRRQCDGCDYVLFQAVLHGCVCGFGDSSGTGIHLPVASGRASGTADWLDWPGGSVSLRPFGIYRGEGLKTKAAALALRLFCYSSNLTSIRFFVFYNQFYYLYLKGGEIYGMG